MGKSRALDLSSLLENLSVAVYVVDEQRRVVFVNRACEALLGEPAERLVGLACTFHSAVGSDLLAQLAGSLCPPPEVFEGSAVSGTAVLPGPDAAPVERQLRWYASHDAAGRIRGVVGMILEAAELAEPPGAAARPPVGADAHDQLAQLRRKLAESYRFDHLIGRSAAMRTVLDQIRLAADCDVPVLIRGEPGTGRELAARTIHYASRRRDAPLVPLDCEALPAEVVERTLRRLVLPLAEGEPQYLRGLSLEGGSLLVQEVTELPRDAQAHLAVPFSDGDSRDVPIRLMATTSRDVAEAQAAGKLREELYQALRTLVIDLPPLRKRLDDLPLLAQHFLEQQNARGGHQVGSIAAEAMDILQSYAWPGNVRELAEAIAAAHGQAEGSRLNAANLPLRLRSAVDAAGLKPNEDDEPIALEELLTRTETDLIRRALSRAKGNKSRAADLLGISRPRLYRRIEQLGIEEADRGRGEATRGERS